jgi:SAM-dependent methyltransferase
MKQRLSEWLETSRQGDFSYHLKQYAHPYRSTVHFCRWLAINKVLERSSRQKVLDIAAGMGASTCYLAKKHPRSSFVGIDIDPELVKRGNGYLRKLGQKNCKLEKSDLYNLHKKYGGKYDGVVSLQTLSWLPDYKLPLQRMLALRPKWLALSSLFFPGNIECKIQVRDYSDPLISRPCKEEYYNIYSLKRVQEFFSKHGYSRFTYAPFTIDIDLPKPTKPILQTYTETLKDGRRLQISGPLLMNWYFILARR